MRLIRYAMGFGVSDPIRSGQSALLVAAPPMRLHVQRIVFSPKCFAIEMVWINFHRIDHGIYRDDDLETYDSVCMRLDGGLTVMPKDFLRIKVRNSGSKTEQILCSAIGAAEEE